MSQITLPLIVDQTQLHYTNPVSRFLNYLPGLRSRAPAYEIKYSIKKLSQEPIEIEELTPLFLAALKTSYFSPVENELKKILKQFDANELKDLLKTALIDLQETNPAIIINRLIKVLDLSQLEEVYQLDDPTFELANAFDDIKLILKQVTKNRTSPSETPEKKGLLGGLKKAVLNFLKIIVYCARLINLGTEPTNFIEAKTMLDVWNFFYLIPVAIFTALAFFVSPLISIAVTVAVIAIILLAAYIYSTKFSPVPETLPHCELIKPSHSQQILGREKEQLKLESELENPDNKNVLLVGHPGTGKTSLASFLAKKYPEKKVFYSHIGDLIQAETGFAILSPLEQIIKKMGHHKDKIILVLDEFGKAFEPAHKKLGDQLMSLLDSSPGHSLSGCIGITTLETYRKNIQNNNELEGRRLRPLFIKSTDRKQTVSILKRHQAKLGVLCADGILERIYSAKKNIPNRYHPDLALDIFNRCHKKLSTLQKGEEFYPKLAKRKARKAKVITQISEDATNIVNLKEYAKKILKRKTKVAKTKKKIEQHRQRYKTYHQLRQQHDWFFKKTATLSSSSLTSVKSKKELLLYFLGANILQMNLSSMQNDLPYLEINEAILEKVLKEMTSAPGDLNLT